MSTKIVSIKMPANTDDRELDACTTALSECCAQIGESSPGLVTVAWIVRGNIGHVAALREADTDKMVIQPSAHDAAQNLAWAIAALPSALVDVFAAEFDFIRARIEAARMPQETPQETR